MVVRINGAIVQRAGGAISNGDVHATGLPNIRVNGTPIAVDGQLSVGRGDLPPSPAKAITQTVRAQGLPIIKAGDPYGHGGLAAPVGP